MFKPSSETLKIAVLHYQRADFEGAVASAREVINRHASLGDLDWLEAVRVELQALSELDRFQDGQQRQDQILNFLKGDADLHLCARAEVLLAFIYLQEMNIDASLSLLGLAMEKATLSQDLECLARGLMLESFIHSLSAQWSPAARSLKKLEVLTQELGLVDIEISADIMRAYASAQQNQHEKALSLLWETYSKAQKFGQHLVIPGILFQVARLHRDKGQMQMAQVYYDLCMKGVDSGKHPRQYKLITDRDEGFSISSGEQFDFVIDEKERSIHERSQGYLDFKNQHLLLDLALLFLKNPGTRYSKEELIEKIWQLAYDSSIHDNLIYVSIKRLRSLIEPDINSPRYLLRDRKGYYFSSNISIHFQCREETTT